MFISQFTIIWLKDRDLNIAIYLVVGKNEVLPNLLMGFLWMLVTLENFLTKYFNIWLI